MSWSYRCVGCNRSTLLKLKHPFNEISVCLTCQGQLFRRSREIAELLGEMIRA